jgi:hypothetical protein
VLTSPRADPLSPACMLAASLPSRGGTRSPRCDVREQVATGRGQFHAGDRPLVGEAPQPYVDRAMSTVLADHIRDGYPTYTDAQIDSGVNTWLVILSLVGALGITSWCLTIWALKSSKRWAASAMFAVGTSVALSALLVKDTSGDTGLAPLLGSIGVLPCIAGVVAVAMLWRPSS